MIAQGPPKHRIYAHLYAQLSPGMERAGAADLRPRLLEGLSGRVIEVGAGNGANFPHYPPQVTGVLAVEPEPHLRRIAHDNAGRSSVPIEIMDGVAEQLPGDDASFDAGVASLVLCSVTDLQRALAELYRVIRPGGELRFLEHVRADTRGMERVQRLLDATLWPKIAGGCHSNRDTAAAIEQAGFMISRLDRVRFPDTRIPLPTSPHIIGVASRRVSQGGT